MVISMTCMTLLLLRAGFALLVGGAELLVRGAAHLAIDLGLSPLVVGLTVVAFCTSAPELGVSVFSVWNDQAGIALGNVVGSNIANVLLILGLSALVAPLVVHRQVIRLEVPIMIGVSLLFLLFALDGSIGRFEGFLLFAGVISYVTWTVRRSRRESRAVREELPAEAQGPSNRTTQLLQIAAGLLLLVLGARWLVRAAVAIAQSFGVSDMVIGLTVVAVGTSLPELATSALASLRGQRDIAVGNVVGSNIFNILCVLGLTALVSPGGVPVPPETWAFDLPVMLAVAVACLPVAWIGHRIERWEGGLFLIYYGAYTLILFLMATGHPNLRQLMTTTAWFVAPLTAITLGISLWQTHRNGSAG